MDMTHRAETWSAYYVDPRGVRIAAAKIIQVKPDAPASPSVYNVMVAVADPTTQEVFWAIPDALASSLAEAELFAADKVEARALAARCDGWRLDRQWSSPEWVAMVMKACVRYHTPWRNTGLK
jgi:hypothetical protein